jgi:ketosteroid isomerase-like protein
VSENYGRLLEGIARWNEGDLEAALEYASDDVRWYPGSVFPDWDEIYVGKQGIRDFFASFEEPWEWIAVDHLEEQEIANRIVVRARFRARSNEGVDVDIEVGQLWIYGGDGLIAEFRGFATYYEAREAALRAQ